MFNPRRFLDFAKRFNLLDLDEADYRTAIGRAYYSVFLVAREELEAR